MGIKKAWKRLLVVLLMLPPAVFADDLAGTAWDLKMNYHDHIRMMILFEQNHTFSVFYVTEGRKHASKGFLTAAKAMNIEPMTTWSCLSSPEAERFVE